MDLVTRPQATTVGGAAPPSPAPPGRATLRWVEACLGPGAQIKMVRPLAGGASHINHALLIESRAGSVHRLVLRRWRRKDPPTVVWRQSRWSADAEFATEHEFSPEREIAALALLAGCEIPTPSLIAADPAGAYCDAPALLITRLIGHPPRPAPDDLPEYAIQLAAALVTIHSLSGASTMPHYVPYNRLEVRRPPRYAVRPQVWDRAFEIAAGPSPEAVPRFIHRDYHLDNTLWSYGRLTGIVDWSSASYGPIAIDIAHMRRTLALRYGLPAADRFLASFDQVSGGYTHDPHWDLRCVLDLLPEDGDQVIDEATVPIFEDYLAACMAQLV